MRRAPAEACVSHLENRIVPEAQALSLFEADEAGVLWQVEAYFASAREAADACAGLTAIPGWADCETTVEEITKTDWVRRSLEGLGAVRAGRFFVHGSHDRESRPFNGIAIEVDAATAFGTGHHGSTRGCLIALDGLLRKRTPKRVLDIGSGSGILAIAASRAIRRRVLACDTDPEAVQITDANAKLNSAAVTAVVAAGTKHAAIGAAAPYDLILANILARPLVQMAPSLARIASRGGHIILSGLVAEQSRWMVSAYRGLGCVLERRIDEAGWTTLVMRRS
jgi:ribosomal protein L11 methyltransferase